VTAKEAEILRGGLECLGLDPGPEKRKDICGKFAVYAGELEKWNSLFGLVGASGEDLIIRHILDCLAGLGPILRAFEERPRKLKSLADLGSGAGFPGIPLALFLPQTTVTLVEPSVKRCAFLRSAAALMDMPNIGVFEGELALLHETFDLVTFRAFRPLDKKILRRLLAITAPGGIIAAYKGTQEKTQREIAAAGSLHIPSREETLAVPFLNEERRLVFFFA
jgi:16S rRNA (guanine527-N7)-methyltransferase